MVEAEFIDVTSGLEAASQPSTLLIKTYLLNDHEQGVFEIQSLALCMHPAFSANHCDCAQCKKNGKSHASEHHDLESERNQKLVSSHYHEFDIYLYSFSTRTRLEQCPHRPCRCRPYRVYKRLLCCFHSRLGLLVRFASKRSSRRLSNLQHFSTRNAGRRRTLLPLLGPVVPSWFPTHK